MAQTNGTIFQKLTTIFGYKGRENPSNRTMFNFSKDELLRTDSKEEYDKALLQAQQSKFMSDKWVKIDQNIHNQSIYYSPNRLGAYYDYENMEFMPEISNALDIISEESTQLSEKGKMLTVFSESDRIREELEMLFEDTLDINTNLPMWIRSLCKYGDNFIYLKSLAEKGIVGCQQLPNIEIDRVEGFSVKNVTSSKNELTFQWKNQNMEFQSWEIAHFRLLGDDRKLPYGTSFIDKIRRVYKQLLMAEDAMLVYRITRAPERRVFKIYVGNMDEKDVDPYIQRVANKFKRDVVPDSKNGQVDMRYNQMAIEQDFYVGVRDPSQPSPIETLAGACVSLDTRIPLLDGRTLSLNEIITEWNEGNRDLWVYSVNPNDGETAPGLITWAGITRKNTNVMKITLDNGKELITTPDHKFVHRTNGFVEAQNLNVGDSLMPFYSQSKSNDYHQIWDNKTQEWVYTHRLVHQFNLKNNIINEEYKNSRKGVIHHNDINRFNNNRPNLLLINWTNLEKMIKNLSFKNFCEWWYKECKLRGFINQRQWKYYIDKSKGKYGIKGKTLETFYNHKIIKIEYLPDTIDTGTITVDGNEIYHNFHTFATESGVYVKNSNLAEISDIEYLQKKMVGALKIPKAFLGFEDITGDGKSLALMDIRFARTINKIQKFVIQELNKIAVIHLLMLGYEDDVKNFTLSLTNPSTQSDLLRLEQWSEKVTLYKDITTDQSGVGILPSSHTWAKKNVFGWSDSEILNDLQQQRLERALGAELMGTQIIIPRTGVFDNVDAKYGISEEERKKVEDKTKSDASAMGGGDMGDTGLPSVPPIGGGEEPLSENIKPKTLIIEDEKPSFDFLKGQRNLNEIENEINNILND